MFNIYQIMWHFNQLKAATTLLLLLFSFLSKSILIINISKYTFFVNLLLITYTRDVCTIFLCFIVYSIANEGNEGLVIVITHTNLSHYDIITALFWLDGWFYSHARLLPFGVRWGGGAGRVLYLCLFHLGE